MIQKKVCILGPTGVGKTSLIKQFVEGIFSEKYKTTIGVKIDKKQVNKDGRFGIWRVSTGTVALIPAIFAALVHTLLLWTKPDLNPCLKEWKF